MRVGTLEIKRYIYARSSTIYIQIRHVLLQVEVINLLPTQMLKHIGRFQIFEMQDNFDSLLIMQLDILRSYGWQNFIVLRKIKLIHKFQFYVF